MVDAVPQHMKFAASPASIAEESRACWIQRVCGAHDYSMSRFCRAVGLKPSQIDWDRSVTPAGWAWLAKNAGHCLDCFDRNDSDWALISQLTPQPVTAFFVDKKPASKWCSICLAADPIPFLRWFWRMAELRTCPFHDIELSASCTWCGACLNLSLANLVPRGKNWGASSLADCASCGMPRLAPEVGDPSARYHLKPVVGQPWEPLQEVRSVLTLRALHERWAELDIFDEDEIHLRPGGALPHAAICLALLNRDPLGSGGFGEFFRRQATVIQAFSAPRDYALLKLTPLVPNKPVPLILKKDLESDRDRPFEVDFGRLAVSRRPLPGKPMRRTYFWSSEEMRWSTGLSPASRIRLAKAISILRKEKNRHRHRALHGSDEDEEQQLIDAWFGSERSPSL